jgi:hypothetical protein
MRARVLGTVLGIATLAASSALAQTAGQSTVSLGGVVDLIGRNTQADLTNRDSSGASYLDALRTTLFVDAALQNNVQLHTQFLIYGYGDVFLYGGYVTFKDVAGGPVSFNAGLIPTTIGQWGPRTHSDTNPLVGVPLMWNHETSLFLWEPQAGVADLLAARDTRPQGGVPMVYESWWNTGVEAYGSAGAFDWSLAAITGSPSLPTRDRAKDLPQGTVRLVWNASPALAVGASGFGGTWLWYGLPGITDKSADDKLNYGGGADLTWTMRYLEVHSEYMVERWDHPVLPTLKAQSAYLEAKYKLHPRWYVAARGETFRPDKVRDDSGNLVHWDYPVNRIEYGVGFHPTPGVTIKGVIQSNRFVGGADSLDENHYLIQLSTRF